MTNDEIIHAAFPVSYTQPGERIMTITDDEIVKLAREAGFEILDDEIGINDRWHIQTDLIKRLICVVAAAEREACAKVCDDMEEKAEGTECCKWPTPIDCAEAIRNRGQA